MSELTKRIAKTVCVFVAVFSLTLLSACDLFSGLGGSSSKEDEVTISQSAAQIKVGASITLTAVSSEKRAISWITSDETIVEVDGGVVTGVSEGTASVTASDGKKMASCEIEVIPADKPVIPDEGDGDDDDNKGEEKPDAVTVTISQTKAEIEEGASITLTASASDGSKITWSSTNGSVALVSSNGKVTGIMAGTATIKAKSGTAVAQCEVTVKAKAEEPPVDPNPPVDPDNPPVPGKKLVWSDEFNGNSLDMTKWGYQTGTKDHYGNSWGPDYWGNGELQYYTDGANVKVADGALEITAKRQNMGDRPFTSARITTRDKFSITFGYIEARIKSPAIEGMWPAFWMLPQPPDSSTSNTDYGGWPANGEIDIMEAKGREQNEVDCTLHFGGPDWNIHDMAGKGDIVLDSNIDEWHTYAVDWRADYIAWIIDGDEVARIPASRWWTSASKDSSAPFDKPFYILLNLAVGGQYDGYREPAASFTQASMYIDYVRVYE